MSATQRRSEYDVTDRINTTDSAAVTTEVCSIYQDLYQRENSANLVQAFEDYQAGRLGSIPAVPVEPRPGHDVL